MLIVTISGGRAGGKSTLMRTVSALLTKMVPGLRIHTREQGEHRAYHNAVISSREPVPHIYFQTVDTNEPEAKNLYQAHGEAKRIADRVTNTRTVNVMEPWAYELTDEQKAALDAFAANAKERNAWLRGNWSKPATVAGRPGDAPYRFSGTLQDNLNQSANAPDYAKLHPKSWKEGDQFYSKDNPPFLNADYAIIEARALLWATEEWPADRREMLEDWADQNLSPGVAAKLFDSVQGRSLYESEQALKPPLSERTFMTPTEETKADEKPDRIWKRFSLVGLPIWIEVPSPLPADLPAMPSTCDLLPIWHGSVPYAEGYGYSSDGNPPATAKRVDWSGSEPDSAPQPYSENDQEFKEHKIYTLVSREELERRVRLNNPDLYAPYVKPTLQPGDDQATQDAIVREVEADESYAEHEVEAGRAKRIWKTYQMYNAMKEYSADGQGSALHQQWAEVLKDAEIGAFFVTYEIIDLTKPGTLWKALIRDYTRSNNPPPHLVNHTWKSDIPSGAYRPPAPDALAEGYAERKTRVISAEEAEAGRQRQRDEHNYLNTKAVSLSYDELINAIEFCNKRFEDSRKVDDDNEGHSGSPGEYLYERLSELEAERDRRDHSQSAEVVQCSFKDSIEEVEKQAKATYEKLIGMGVHESIARKVLPCLNWWRDTEDAASNGYGEGPMGAARDMAQAIQMLRNEASLGRATKLRESLGFSLIVQAWDRYVALNPEARLDGPQMDKIRKAAKRH